jgi:two-component system sensor histidine kinase/response regulator
MQQKIGSSLILAHDLRSPVGNIMQISEFLDENFIDFSEEKKKTFVNLLRKLSGKTFDLLENLLTWSRIQLNKVDFSPEKFNLHEIVNKTISIYEENVKQKDISLTNNIKSTVTPFGNKESVNVVFRNLITNAIKFTPNGGSITIESNQITIENSPFISVSVCDSGVGIPEDQIQNLFKIDTNYTTEGTNNEEGTGLGLILCKEFVEKNGGTIKVQNNKPSGTIFTFTIPA